MSDTERLKFIMKESGIEGFIGVAKDRYEYALDIAIERGRDEPNERDEMDGFRMLIDEAMRTGGEHKP